MVSVNQRSYSESHSATLPTDQIISSKIENSNLENYSIALDEPNSSQKHYAVKIIRT